MGPGNFAPTGVRTPGVLPIASRWTDYATPATLKSYMCVCVAIYGSRAGLISQADDGPNSLHYVFPDLFHINYCDSSGTKQDALSLNQIHLSTKVSLKNLHPIAQNLPLLTRPATHAEMQSKAIRTNHHSTFARSRTNNRVFTDAGLLSTKAPLIDVNCTVL